MDFWSISILAVFIIPAIFGVMSAAKGTSLSETKARCENCGMMIPASASTCPHCLKRSPFISKSGFSYINKSKTKAESNTPMSRFIRTYIIVFVLEFVLVCAVGSIFS